LLNVMTFGSPEWLWALLAIPVLALLFYRAQQRSAALLREFVSPRLLPQLGATVNRFRRTLRFSLLLLGVALAIVSLAKPRWGFTYEEVKRKGLDLIFAVDTSRSMLANDVPPNRLQRVKLAAQDLMRELRGDRVGLIAFAGRAFLQAPLTIDYGAAVEALMELDTSTIPEGGTNISEAINLAVKTFGKSAVGNRALIIFTDGEELAGDSAKVAKNAADAGVRIFTIGVGTPEGSLIPLPAQGGGSAFVKDRSGQVVKSKLDEKRLREIAEATGGFFLPLGNSPATMRQLYSEGLAQMQAGEIDARMARQPIERYQWPLGAALLALAASLLINERKRQRVRPVPSNANAARAVATAAALFSFASIAAGAAAPGLDAYRQERFNEAYQEFQRTLQEHPDTAAADKLHFNAGAAAYKMKDYEKALQSFSQALLSKDKQLQSSSHYNLGNTLYGRGENEKATDKKLADWNNALQHFENTLKLHPENKEAKENAEYVQQRIAELKKEQEEQQPSPTPSPSPNQQKKDEKKKDQQQDQSGRSDDQQPQDGEEQSEQQGEGKNDKPQPGQSPSGSPPPEQGSSPTPSPTPDAGDEAGEGPPQTPTPGEQQGEASPTPGESGDNASPTPSPGEGEESSGDGSGGESTPAPSPTPDRKLTGDVKGASEDQASQAEAGQTGEPEPVQEGQMTEEQAKRLLESMKDEEQRVQLDERRPVRRVYDDW
jgi:Ca-activated chloride channel family protein